MRRSGVETGSVNVCLNFAEYCHQIRSQSQQTAVVRNQIHAEVRLVQYCQGTSRTGERIKW